MKNSNISHDGIAAIAGSPNDTRTGLGNPRESPDNDDTNSGFATSGSPPLPTLSTHPLFEEVRRLKAELEAERRKAAALEKELAAAKHWFSQAPAEVAALVSSNVTKNETAAAGSHEDFRQRTGNPCSSFFSSNSRIDPSYNHHVNPNQNARRLADGGHDRAEDAHSRLLGPSDYLGHGSGASDSTSREIRGGGSHGNPFPGPLAATDYSWGDAIDPRDNTGSHLNVQTPDKSDSAEVKDGRSAAEKAGGW
ncbi:hypothetical protein SLS58_010677 [Diplodia intermedia]|uniref:Uncharacterized protein n=1 Tax=Diplodia intermedia TaxID=856260 RepID=A0ABR3T551_9PEZI